MSDKITCPQCGQELDEGTLKCFQCGAETTLPVKAEEEVKEAEVEETENAPEQPEAEKEEEEVLPESSDTPPLPVGEVAPAIG